MTNEQNHIIQKLSVEVNVPDLSMARRIHNNIGGFLQDTVLPAVAQRLNELIKKEEYYRTANITLDLSFDRESDLEDLLAPVLSSAVAAEAIESLKRKKEKKDTEDVLQNNGNELKDFQKKTGKEKSWDVFTYFLQTGCSSWYAGSESIIEEEQLIELITGDEQKSFLKNLLYEDSAAAERLIKQFSYEFVIRVIKKIYDVSIESRWAQIEKISSGHDATERDLIRRETLIHLVGVIACDPQINGKKTKDPQIKKKKPVAFEETGIYVQNAGLVLLHPFLLYFLREFGLLNKEENFKDDASQQTAIHLLHYLATGKEQPFEYDLLIEKFMCGYDINKPAERFIMLTDKMKEECDHLLKAVIHHWKALKNTSPDGLRQGFLQRNGKLSLTTYQQRLIIESNSIDILLNQLPWNYSIIQLPWLQKVFYVDWLTN